jgi:hypothetical protein
MVPALALPPKAAQCVQWLPRELWPALDTVRVGAEAESACGSITIELALSWGRVQELRSVGREFRYPKRA